MLRGATPRSGCIHILAQRTRAHGQHHVEAEHARHELGEAREHVVVECAAAQCEALRLVGQGLDQLGVAVALVDGGVGR